MSTVGTLIFYFTVFQYFYLSVRSNSAPFLLSGDFKSLSGENLCLGHCLYKQIIFIFHGDNFRQLLDELPANNLCRRSQSVPFHLIESQPVLLVKHHNGIDSVVKSGDLGAENHGRCKLHGKTSYNSPKPVQQIKFVACGKKHLQFSVADAIDDLTNILGYIQKIKGGFQDAEEEGNSFGSSLEKTTGDARKGLEGIGTEARNTAEMFGSVSHSGDEIKESILGARSAFNRMGVSAKENAADAGAGLDQASSAAGGVIRSLREISKVGNEAAAGYEQIGSQAKTAGILAEKGAKGSEEALTIADQEAKSLQESYKEIGDQAKTVGIRSEDGIGKAGTALNSVSNQAEKFADSIQTAGIRAEAAGEQAGKSAEDASNKLNLAKSAADRLKVSYRETGDAASSEMDKASQATEAATDSLEKVIPSGEKVKKAYREIGAAAESFGSAVVLSSREAMRETNSFGSTLKAGIEGAYGYAEEPGHGGFHHRQP